MLRSLCRRAVLEIEYRPNSLKGVNLKDLVDGVVAQAELPKFLTDLKKDLELIKSGLSRAHVEKNTLSDLITAKLANLMDLLFKRLEERLKGWITGLAEKLAGALQGYVSRLEERVRQLEEENRRLKERIKVLEREKAVSDLMKHPAWRKLEELARPNELRPALIKVNLREGYVAFSDDLWKYIMSRTPQGTRRGLDRALLDQVEAREGPKVVELLLMIQRLGKVSIESALSTLDQGL